jgi:DNA-binding PadR family transcriptional regulator
MDNISKDQMGANITLMLLISIQKEDSYGYAIVQRINKLSEGRINIQESVCYPILKRLEEKKMVKSYWKMIEGKRPRKYYKILTGGLREIERLIEERDFMKGIVTMLQDE